MDYKLTSFQEEGGVFGEYGTDEEVSVLPDFKKYSKQCKRFPTQPDPKWGGSQDQQFASTERKKTKSKHAWEKEMFFASAIPFANQDGVTGPSKYHI
jgi:hypothetical protein